MIFAPLHARSRYAARVVLETRSIPNRRQAREIAAAAMFLGYLSPHVIRLCKKAGSIQNLRIQAVLLNTAVCRVRKLTHGASGILFRQYHNLPSPAAVGVLARETSRLWGKEKPSVYLSFLQIRAYARLGAV